LKKYEFGNATWLDLVSILNEQSNIDVSGWSQAWVEEAGRPLIQTKLDGGRIAFIQSDPQAGRSLHWPEQMEVLAGSAKEIIALPVAMENERTELNLPRTIPPPQLVLPTGGGLAYGDFALDDGTRAYLLHHLPELNDPLTRGAAWVTLWEEMLDRRVDPLDF